jgi:hypothetical protein
VTNFEKSLDFRDGYLPAAAGVPIVPTVKTAALVAVLLAYAVGFAILYPIAETSVSKNLSPGNNPAATESASQLVR